MNDPDTQEPSLRAVRVIFFLLLCAAALAAPFVESGKPARIQPSGFTIKP